MKANLKSFVLPTCALGLGLAGLLLAGRLVERTPSAPSRSTAVAETAETTPESLSIPTKAIGSRTPGHESGAEKAAPALPPELSAPPDDPDEARAWTLSNPETAILWIVNAPPGTKRDAVIEIACAEIAQFDPAEAVALAEYYAGSWTPLLENLFHQWAYKEEAEAAAYALSKLPGDVRNRLLGRLALVRSTENPADAARLVDEEIPPGDVRDEAVIGVLHRWISHDPESAMDWVKSFPKGDLRDRALYEMENAVRLTANRDRLSP